MEKKDKVLSLPLDNYDKQGLYLIVKDSQVINLTKESIEKLTLEFWNNPSKISPQVKEVAEFQRCPFCPLKGEKTICDAIRPVLPLIEQLDKFVSFDEVTAVYRGEDNKLYHLAVTNMQTALKYIAITSLVFFCQYGKKYQKYFWQIMPLSGGHDCCIRMYLNIYSLHKGKEDEIKEIILKFVEKIRITTQNQVKRLNMICKNDALMNAFVNTQVTSEFLNLNVEQIIKTSIDNLDNASPVQK